jgi:hypothetical protein
VQRTLIEVILKFELIPAKTLPEGGFQDVPSKINLLQLWSLLSS